ncbi:MAG: hypothetical protein IPK13_02935 [Deltaproteobacteria bacterium]|nr:hypothetical protein [Deltaproteobacteria bacterium]
MTHSRGDACLFDASTPSVPDLDLDLDLDLDVDLEVDLEVDADVDADVDFVFESENDCANRSDV